MGGLVERVVERKESGMTALEILDQLLLGQMAFHRRPDAWDLVDAQGHVPAVLCPRTKRGFVAISPCPDRPPLRRDGGGFVPYKEKVKWRITSDNVDEGVARVRELVAGPV
jgi:hypothetical protein